MNTIRNNDKYFRFYRKYQVEVRKIGGHYVEVKVPYGHAYPEKSTGYHVSDYSGPERRIGYRALEARGVNV